MENSKSLIDPFHFLYWMMGYHNEVGEEIRLINGRFCFCSESEEPDPITSKAIVQLYFLHYPDKATDHATLRARNERMERALKAAKDALLVSEDNGDDFTSAFNKFTSAYKLIDEALSGEPEPQPTGNITLQEIPSDMQAVDYPKLTREQIQERKEAIEWIRNPGGMRWVKASERLPDDKKRNYIFRQAGNTRSARTIYLDYCPNIPALLQLPIENIEWLDEGKEVENA